MGIKRVVMNNHEYFASNYGDEQKFTPIAKHGEVLAKEIAEKLFLEMQRKSTGTRHGRKRVVKENTAWRDKAAPLGVCVSWTPNSAGDHKPVVSLNIKDISDKRCCTTKRVLQKGVGSASKYVYNKLVENDYVVPDYNTFVSQIKYCINQRADEFGFNVNDIPDFHSKEYLL